MKKAISDILWELIPHENKYVITEKDLLDYITELNKTIDKIVLKCFDSCMTLRQFKNIYKLAYNKEYKEPKDLEGLKEGD